jgi:two-component system, sensor histidine kinase and response regulator
MSAPRRILMVEDSADDAELTARALRRSGCELSFERVETPETMRAALLREKWDLVIADYSMPHFDGLAALKLLQEQGLDLPFILVSGTVGEDVAVEAMKCGAGDYVLKNNLVRLPLAVERELRDFEMRGARKRAEEEANRARDRVRDLALETARLRSDFLASMSHEIRTPLVGIIGTGELLSLSDLTPEQRRQTEIIRSSGELLLTIVNDILDFSKLSAGKVVLEELDFDLVELTENLADSFAGVAHAKGIEIALHVDVNMPTGLRGDPARLRQILNNLVSNAIKFTQQGEVMIRTNRVEDTDNDEVLVRFEITDTGIGIPSEAQQRLFQPFVQAEGSTSRRFGGTGLGLVIAAKLTKQMGGEIGFESAPGKGSTFHFTARLKKGPSIVHPWMTATATSCFNGVRALLVNDGSAWSQGISEYLSSWGIENVEIGDEAQALGSLKPARQGAEKQAVILIDEQASDIDALRLARAIKDRSDINRCKIIMFSAESAVLSGTGVVDAWITKPVRPSHLFSCLLKLFGNADPIDPKTIAAAPSSPAGDEQPQWRKAVRVLLVDDNFVNRTIGAKQLSVLGYTAEVVDGARRGLEVVQSGRSDIVLMDCEMPEMDGYQAVAEIRRREATSRHTW